MSGPNVLTLDAKTVTWGQAYRLFLLSRKAQAVSAGTLEQYGWTLEKDFLPWLAKEGGDPKPSGLQPGHVRAWLEHLKGKGQAGETVQSGFSRLRAFLRFLKQDGLLAGDPLKGVPMPKAARRLVRPFTPDQFRQVLALLSGNAFGCRDRAVFGLLLDSGLRLGEALSLNIGDVDMAGNTARVMGKGGKERRVCWGESARRWLWAWLRLRPEARPADPLFIDRTGARLKKGRVQKRLKALTKRAGIDAKRLSCHALRHGFAVEFLKGGGDIATLQRLLGHASLELTRRYLNLTDDEIVAQARAHSPLDRLNNAHPLPGGGRRRAVLK